MLADLRDYQYQGSLDARELLGKHKRVIVCSPTGSGKGHLIVDFALRAINKGMTVCILADRTELIDQVTKKMMVFGIPIQFINKENKVIYPSRLYIGMVETFYRRASQKKIPTNIDLFICDEAHVGNYFKLFDLFPDSYYLGPTATPVSSVKNHPLNKHWKAIAVIATIPQLIEAKHIVPAREIGLRQILNLQVKAGTFTSESQKAAFDENKVDNIMMDTWMERCRDLQTIVFCINVQHSIEVCKMFNDNNIIAEHIDANTDETLRTHIIGRYKKGFTQVLCNVGITGKGFDSPHTKCVVVDRATESLSAWIQMAGRGARPFEDHEFFYLLDMGNNALRHGSFNDEIDWKMVFENDVRDKNFKVTIKFHFCPVCFTMHSNIFITTCYTCGNDFTKNKLLSPQDAMPEHLKDRDLYSMSYEELREYGKYKGYKANWAFMFKFKKAGHNQRNLL